MDLNYVLQTLLKILISTPGLLLICRLSGAYGAALLGNGSSRNFTDVSSPYYDYELSDSQELEQDSSKAARSDSEEIPDPEPLVLPGYNLPENIFNRGKPFYVEKDPLTGKIDFTKTASSRMDEDLYDYEEEPPSSNIYDKSNIDRKDGSLSGHRPSDVNQLIPNFHDFLNLPVKYNSAKYVYPLISSSYASTKYQGSANKFHNHKDYPSKLTTKKPLVSPTYYTTEKYFKVTYSTTTPSTTTTQKTTTTTQKRPETTKIVNLLNTAMGVGYSEDFDDYYDTTTTTTKKPTTKFVPSTTESPKKIYITSRAPSSTTKKVMSLFEQLFGDYEDNIATTITTKVTSTPKYEKTEKPTSTTSSTSTSTKNTVHNSHAGPFLTPSPDFNYEYEDIGDNIAVENKPVASTTNNDSKIVPLHVNATTQRIQPTKNVENMHINNNTDYYDYIDDLTTTTTTTTTTTVRTSPTPVMRVTSLPLGENHLTTSGYEPFKNREPIIVATQNLREKLNSEKVPPRPFEKPASSNNIHIAHDQNTVSFVLGNQQNVLGTNGDNNNQYYGTAIKEIPYDSNPFRPYYGHGTATDDNEKEITLQGTLSFPEVGSAVTIQPQKNSEASLAIGVPINDVNKQIPGQVMDEKLEIDDPQATLVKVTGGKVVFPDDKQPEYPDLMPPPMPASQPSREVLQLNSKPVYHQLPSDLTPPREQEVVHKRPIRPPWDPRPGHFYSGNPEYNRPPRPHTDVAYKRIDNLPNILPQFRPNNMHKHPPVYYDKRLNRQPLLDRPSNRPMNFYEKLHPPPPPPPPYVVHKNLQALRKNILPPRQSLDDGPGKGAEDRILNEDQTGLYQTPPQVKIANRRSDADVMEVETLQMIQAKSSEKKNTPTKDGGSAMVTQVMNVQANEDDSHKDINIGDKTIYKVYPVNSAPIKLDVIDDSNKKETVVIGTRSERPLPPSKINQNFDLLFDTKDRNDDPILKPHKPPTFPIKSDFPYPLERPGADPSINLPSVPDTPSKTGNDLDEPDYFLSNQWNTIGDNYESRIVNGNGNKIAGLNNQISVTLRTNSDKPIAVAYTPTEPNLNADKYSMPNYGSPVIPEIRPSDGNKVFTVSAVMHTHQQNQNAMVGSVENVHRLDLGSNHRNDVDVVPDYPKLDFEAPFQASLNIENTRSQGWSVVKTTKNSTTTESPDVTTMPYATTSEFDIENFKPQLEGGFKPIFNFPDDDKKFIETKINDREE
ncbi:unnamed protein product [Psylliodes chrysocephalus]|uniref:Uncharacterized protein n=1 Tax=Psylliodes chrysocephalus TaxID=3402493 RepID=A0A9P0GJ33_9CUCU|nr:unnamed protein product [Psylliodes chrysocephala]